MDTLFAAAFRAVRSLSAPGMIGIFLFSVVITLVVLCGFVGVVTMLSGMLADKMSDPMWAAWTPWIGGAGAFFIAWFLFPGIMPIIVNFFDEKIARAIESQDYPNAIPHETPLVQEFLHDLKFSLLAIGLNVLILPLYLIPGLNFILFYGLNGYLLGREFFMMAARRHISIPEAAALRRKYSNRIFVGGVLLAVLATIPFFNLFAPFWGVAVMVHLYQDLSRNG